MGESNEILALTQETFSREVIEGDGLVLVDFWADWCGPCRMLAPLLADLAEVYRGRLKVGKVDVDQNPQLAEEYQIRSIPTLVLFRGGDVQEVIVGLKSKAELKSSIDRLLTAV